MQETVNRFLILVAAGMGSRFGKRKKQFALCHGKPLFLWSLKAFADTQIFHSCVITVPFEDKQNVSEMLAPYNLFEHLSVVEGGATRTESVFHGLKNLQSQCDVQSRVFIHDAARPLIHPEDILSVDQQLEKHPASVLGTPCVDTIKEVEKGFITHHLDRTTLWAVQTPQAFSFPVIWDAYHSRDRNQQNITDDTALMSNFHIPVSVVASKHYNEKVTFVQDLIIAEFLLKQREMSPVKE